MTTGARPTDRHHIGAASEQLAAGFYLYSGIPVYWPAVQQGAVDFVIEDTDGFHRVQVKTAYRRTGAGRKTGSLRVGPVCPQGTRPDSHYDILFVVGAGGFWQIPAPDLGTTRCVEVTSTKWDSYRV